MAISQNDILQSLINILKSKNANIDTEETVINDILETVAGEVKTIYDFVDHTAILNSLKYASIMTKDELDNFAANFGFSRKTATKASGTVVFYRNTNLGATETIEIPAGFKVSTATTTKINFITTESKSLTGADLNSYYSQENLRYEIPVSVEAELAGTSSNVGAHTISAMESSITNIDGVDNLVSISNGTDDETNERFATRLLGVLSGNNVGTKDGYKSLVESQPNVISAYVATADDPFMLRDANFGGKVDIYIQGQDLVSYSDSFTYEGQNYFVLTKQPVNKVSSVIGAYGGNLTYTFLTPNDYVLTKDTTSVYAGSINAQSRITWVAGGAKPNNNGNVIVNYIYNALPETIQNLINQDSNHIVNADILVKEATPIEIDVAATIAVKPGYNKSTVIEDVKTAVSVALNNYGCGQNVEQSDILNVMYVDGVDRIDLPLSKFCKSGENTVENIIEIEGLQYAVAGTIAIG